MALKAVQKILEKNVLYAYSLTKTRGGGGGIFPFQSPV